MPTRFLKRISDNQIEKCWFRCKNPMTETAVAPQPLPLGPTMEFPPGTFTCAAGHCWQWQDGKWEISWETCEAERSRTYPVVLLHGTRHPRKAGLWSPLNSAIQHEDPWVPAPAKPPLRVLKDGLPPGLHTGVLQGGEQKSEDPTLSSPPSYLSVPVWSLQWQICTQHAGRFQRVLSNEDNFQTRRN